MIINFYNKTSIIFISMTLCITIKLIMKIARKDECMLSESTVYSLRRKMAYTVAENCEPHNVQKFGINFIHT